MANVQQHIDNLFWDAWAIKLHREAEASKPVYNPLLHIQLQAEENAIKTKAREIMITRHILNTGLPLDAHVTDKVVANVYL